MEDRSNGPRSPRLPDVDRAKRGRVLDIRCSASLGEPTREKGRCQLLMGHEGTHAVMFGRDGHLEVRCWTGNRIDAARDHVAASEMRPWARGYPAAAWIDRPELVEAATPASRTIAL